MSKKNGESQRSAPRHWKPGSRGDSISGTLIGVERVRVYGKKVRAAILEAEDGEQWSVLLGYAVLKAKWEQMNPGRGQIVTITVTGFGESKKRGVEYLQFDLHVED